MTQRCLKFLVLICFGDQCVKFDGKNDTLVHTHTHILDELQQVAEVVDDPGCVGEAFAGAVAVGCAAGAGAGVAAHVDVEDGVADYDGFFGLESEFLQGHVHCFRMGFAVGDVVAAEDVGYGGGEA